MENSLSTDEGNANLALLAQAAAIEHALTPLQAIRKYWRACLWCNFMCVGALLWGCNAQKLQPLRLSGWQDTLTSVGSMFGGLSFGWISDHFGRRGAVAIASVFSITSAFIQFLGMLSVGMLVNGFALGVFLSCASEYCVEVSPLALRSITTATVHLWIVLGRFISNGVIWRTSTRGLPLALQLIFPVILLIGLPFAPESPWWLVRKGRHAAAERVFTHLGGPTVDVTFQRQQIQETFELEDSYNATSTYVDCFQGANLRRTVVAMMVFVLQQGTGVVFVSWLSISSFRGAGFVNSDFNFVAGMATIKAVGNLLMFWTVNRFGRRSLVYWGTTCCGFILFSIGLVSLWITSQSGKLTVFAFTVIYNFAYHTSIGPLGYVLFTEVSSAKLRSKTIGLGICANSLCGILTNIIISYLRRSLADKLLCSVFGWLALAGRLWASSFIPETKGRTVDELDLLYEKQVPASGFASHQLYDDGT